MKTEVVRMFSLRADPLHKLVESGFSSSYSKSQHNTGLMVVLNIRIYLLSLEVDVARDTLVWKGLDLMSLLG
jgi:hypothetical protein